MPKIIMTLRSNQQISSEYSYNFIDKIIDFPYNQARFFSVDISKTYKTFRSFRS